MSTRKPVVVVGSINMDLVAVSHKIPSIGETVLGSDFQTYPGGKGANQAVAVARLGYPVQLIGRIGDDAFGSELKTHLENSGVNTDGVLTTKGSSGVAVILVSAAGENSIVVTPGANGKVTPQDIDDHLETIRSAGIVLAQLEIPIETVEYLVELCRREGIPLMLDPAPAAHLSPQLLAGVTWLTPNESEAAFLLAEAPANTSGHAPATTPAHTAVQLLARGSTGVILKLGAAGVYLSVKDGISAMVPAVPVKAVDTTAAGDAFNGGFAMALMSGKSPVESAHFAAAVAGISVTRAGAQPSMPTLEEVETLLGQQATKA